MLTRCQQSQRLRWHTFFANILTKTKKFAKLFLPVHVGRGAQVESLSKKGQKSVDTVPLMFPEFLRHKIEFVFYPSNAQKIYSSKNSLFMLEMVMYPVRWGSDINYIRNANLTLHPG